MNADKSVIFGRWCSFCSAEEAVGEAEWETENGLMKFPIGQACLMLINREVDNDDSGVLE